MTKTITIDGLTSVKIKKSAYDMARFCWIKNLSEADVFASCVNAECTENADEVRRISSGEFGMLDTESYETLYLNGSGAVEIVTSALLVCPFDRGGKGGGSYELPIATTEILGGVMPDGTTITVDENGVISMLGSSGIQMKLLGRYNASTTPIVVIETPIEVGRMFGFYLEGVLKASYFFRIITTGTGSKTSKFDITSNTGKTFNFTVQTNMSNGAGLQMSFSEFISTSIYINVYDMGIVEVTS